MIAIDTEEKLNWLVDGIENGEIVLDNRIRTEAEKKELRMEIAELKSARQKDKTAEAVLV